MVKESVTLSSRGDQLVGLLTLPETARPCPALIFCHGVGEFKENYAEFASLLAEKGVATLAIDMHGHGESGGNRFFVDMSEWVADVCACLDFLGADPRIDHDKLGAFGVSSGGTAILEAAIIDPRLKALVALDATVRNSLTLPLTIFMKILILIGRIKKSWTKQDFRIPLMKLTHGVEFVSDPEINRRLCADTKSCEAFLRFPLPGAAQSFFVDTIKRVSKIRIPTLVIWGEDDKLDPPETARMLYDALACKKQLHIVPGNGHAGHLDRNRNRVFTLTTDWALENLA